MRDLKKPPVQGGSEDDSIPSYSEIWRKISGNEKAALVDFVVTKQAYFKGAFLSSRLNQNVNRVEHRIPSLFFRVVTHQDTHRHIRLLVPS
jgi:hypothetical protein